MEGNEKRECVVTYGKDYTVLDKPFLVLTAQRRVVYDLVQPPDPVEETRIVLEVSDVYSDLLGRTMKFVRTRPMNHIPQLG